MGENTRHCAPPVIVLSWITPLYPLRVAGSHRIMYEVGVSTGLTATTGGNGYGGSRMRICSRRKVGASVAVEEEKQALIEELFVPLGLAYSVYTRGFDKNKLCCVLTEAWVRDVAGTPVAGDGCWYTLQAPTGHEEACTLRATEKKEGLRGQKNADLERALALACVGECSAHCVYDAIVSGRLLFVHSLRVAPFHKVIDKVDGVAGLGDSVGWLGGVSEDCDGTSVSALHDSESLCVSNCVCLLYPDSNGGKYLIFRQEDGDLWQNFIGGMRVATVFALVFAGWVALPKIAEEGPLSALHRGASLYVCNCVRCLQTDNNGEREGIRGHNDAEL
ncbi:hypothetical protein EBH_0076810 [Eimeria brunetti]|uniref:Uncharacterized protein n=1 Tax=Eimeria brunetti TaxID=51314 RepID=U6LJV1_9EIME|nr:hypothetical protein EBH_0076810 [Eimeria brunetti]